MHVYIYNYTRILTIAWYGTSGLLFQAEHQHVQGSKSGSAEPIKYFTILLFSKT